MKQGDRITFRKNTIQYVMNHELREGLPEGLELNVSELTPTEARLVATGGREYTFTVKTEDLVEYMANQGGRTCAKCGAMHQPKENMMTLTGTVTHEGQPYHFTVDICHPCARGLMDGRRHPLSGISIGAVYPLGEPPRFEFAE